MYFRWKDRRLVVEMAAWGAEEGVAAQVLHTLADATKGMIDRGEAEEPADADPAVGIPRNDEPVRVDEEDRQMTLYFWHPEGEIGYFDDVPVDYKLTGPEAPVDGNRAFRLAVEGASGVLLVGSDEPERDRRAFEGLERALEAGEAPVSDSPGGPFELHYVVPPASPLAGATTPSFDMPAGLPEPQLAVARPWDAEDVWDVWCELAGRIEPRLERAKEQGRIPEA